MFKIRGFVPVLLGLLAIAYSLQNGISSQTRKMEQQHSQHGWRVKPGSVYDGDTLRLVRGNEELKVRFCGIDAPEKDQPLGIESRDYLRSLLDKGTGEIILVPIEKDRYGRTVAELFMPIGGEEELLLNAEMVRAGLAWHYGKYSGNCPNQDVLIQQEAIAQSQGLGVHKAGNVKPEEWRRKGE